MQPDPTLIDRLLSGAGVTASVAAVPLLGVVARVDAQSAVAALCALRDSEHAFGFMVDLFGIDTGEAIDVCYHLRSLSHDDEVFVKAEHSYGSVLASIWEVFPAALMPERECAEMFGLSLCGHPNPKRLLTTAKVPPLLLKSVLIRSAEEVRNR